MYDNYNYPMGADTPDAPWNRWDQEEIEVELEVVVSIGKTVLVTTDNYAVEHDEEDGATYTDLLIGSSGCADLFKDQHKSIPYLLGELAKYIKGELEVGGLTPSRRRELQEMLEDCEGWEEGVTEVDDFRIK